MRATKEELQAIIGDGLRGQLRARADVTPEQRERAKALIESFVANVPMCQPLDGYNVDIVVKPGGVVEFSITEPRIWSGPAKRE